MNQQTLMKLITSELNKTTALCLPYSPRAEMIQKTAEVWIETFSDEFTQADNIEIPRIKSAFIELRKKAEQWPPPSALLKYLPAYKKQYCLAPPPPTEEEQQQGKEALKNIISSLSDSMDI